MTPKHVSSPATLSLVGLALLGASSLLSACVGAVDVGDATGGTGGTTDEGMGGTATGGMGGTAECAGSDADRRAAYDSWQAAPNDFGSLAGATFTGYVEGGEDLTLTIGADHSATLVVGVVAPPPVADQGYLCLDEYECFPRLDLAAGATYPIHGATFEAERLEVPIQALSAYDAWCALQVPVWWRDCQFRERANAAISWGDTCTIDGVEADCSYVGLVRDSGPCVCTSVECVAGVQSTEPTLVLDMRFDAAEDKLEGSIGSANVHLFRVTE